MPDLRERARRLTESRAFNMAVAAVIVINAVTLGLETSTEAMDAAGPVLELLDVAALSVFVVELLLKIYVQRLRFFRDGWNIFDFIVVGIALVPAAGEFSVLRALRVLRVLRLISVIPQMRAVVGALLTALPGMGSVIAVLAIAYYVAAVIATKLYGASFPQWFGSIGSSMYSLFQIMTLESWSMGIVRPVMEVHPLAWLFFVPFIVITSFAVLNLFIALIVNAMQTAHDEETQLARAEIESRAQVERAELLTELRALRHEVADLRGTIQQADPEALAGKD
ncbi:MAG: ion transporter [Sneathiellaceae bacterium]